MRLIKEVGVWPVGLVGGLLVEKPLINNKGKVIGWNSAWRPERPFPIDMAGFAINLKVLLNYPNAVFSWDVSRGYQESAILSQVTSIEKLEPLANNCTKVGLFIMYFVMFIHNCYIYIFRYMYGIQELKNQY